LVFRSDHPIAYGVSREIFDDLLLGMAREAGVSVRLRERFVGASVKDGFIEALTNQGMYRVGYVVGADGTGGVVSRMIRGDHDFHYMVAYELRIPGWPFEDPQDTIRIYFGIVPGGYGWVFPKASYTSAGLVIYPEKKSTPRALINDFLRDTLHIEDKASIEVHGGLVPCHSKGRRARLTGDRMLVVGDSGGLVDPFLAEGISYAIQSSTFAAPVIASALARGDGDLSLYETAVRRFFYSQFDSSSTLSKYVHGFPRLSFLVMKKRNDLAEDLFELIRGNKNYEEFVNRFKTAIGSFR
jgi:flavin-dependent dehydrogenase